MTLKHCPKCRFDQAQDQFAIAKDKKDGLDSICKGCKKSYRSRNAVAIRAKITEWEALNQGKVKTAKRIWQANNKVARRIGEHRRRARKRSALVNDFTLKQWLQTLAIFGYECYYCGVGGGLTQDHMIPLSRGGNNTAINVIPACGHCNSRKHAKTIDEFIGSYGC